MEFENSDLGFCVWNLVFGVSNFGVWDFDFGVLGLGFGISNFWFEIL